MKGFLSYMKRNVLWILTILFCGATMAGILFLNRIPTAEIGYGMLLCLLFLAVGIVIDFGKYRQRYETLRQSEEQIKVSLKNLPDPGDLIEEEYQKTLREIYMEKLNRENEFVRSERDRKEYYTMWVHQIKTPIAALKLLLQENSASETERTEELQELFSIEQYVEMALQYARLESETTDFVIKKVELDTVIREAVRKYARQFINKKISLHYEGTGRVVITDEKWLEFVIEQLLSNAIKYTAKGGISIWVEERVGEEVRLIIEDTGIGIRAEDLPRVCEKGYTGYNGHVDKRSTGIGLYLCNSVLKKLNHVLRITSEEGRGTKVEVVFLEQEIL